MKKTKKKKKAVTKALAKVEKAPVNINSTAGLIQVALQSNAGVEQVQKLMDMKYRDEEREARKEFFRAFSQFQADIGPMVKDRAVSFGNTKYKHATLGQIESQIKEPLKDAGLSKRFEITDKDGIKVDCIITHVNGHSERTSMTAPADTSGSKNTIQSRASTVTYLQRYTLIGALGLVTADEDNDGRTSETKPASPPVPKSAKNITPPKEKPLAEALKEEGGMVVDKETGEVKNFTVQINALKRMFAKINEGKTKEQLQSLWVDYVGIEGELTEKRIKELAQEFTKALKDKTNKNGKDKK